MRTPLPQLIRANFKFENIRANLKMKTYFKEITLVLEKGENFSEALFCRDHTKNR